MNRHLMKTEEATVQLNWSSPQMAEPSLSTLLLNGVNQLLRWILTDKVALLDPQPYLPVTYKPAITNQLRMNAKGIEIIKRFEGFPADVEPDVHEAERSVRRLVKVPLTANQFSALVSFTYNVGEPTLRQSALLKHLNEGRYKAAAKQFDLWVYVGSRRFSKLVARRVAERGLFLSTASH